MKKNERQWLQASTVLFILNVAASALNYLCQLVMGRFFSVESYGTINTIFSFMMIVAVPGTTLTMIVAKYYASATDESGKYGYLKKQLRIVLFLTIGVFLLLLSVQKVLADVLSIQDNFVLFLAFVLAALGYFQPFYSGVFSGNKHFVLVGMYSLFIPLYKLAAVGVAYIYSLNDTKRLYMVLIFMVAGVFVTALFGQIKTNGILGKSKKKENFRGCLYTLEDMNALILNISLMLYMNVDLLAVRYYGDELESGLYSSVLLFGRIIYYFATTLGTILLPSVANNSLSDRKRNIILNRTLYVMLLFAVVCMIPINIWKDLFIKILFGENYLPASKYVIYVSIISLSLSIYTILINYVVGIGKTKMAAMVMLIVDLLLGVTICIFHNINTILLSIGGIGIGGALVIYGLNHMQKRE